MSKFHAFTSDSSGDCHVKIHLPMPAGSNLVGQSWRTCWIAAGQNVTGMAEGNGVGQITAVERSSILAGDMIEIDGVVPLAFVRAGIAAVNECIDKIIASKLKSMALEFNYYGFTNG